MSRSQLKGLITRNLHVKYESPTNYGSRDTAKVRKQTSVQGQGHNVEKLKSQLKGLIATNLHVKYDSATTYGSRNHENQPWHAQFFIERVVLIFGHAFLFSAAVKTGTSAYICVSRRFLQELHGF